MIKVQLIDRVAAANPHLRRGDAERTVNAIFEEMAAAMVRGDRIELRRIGAFTVRARRGRSGRNPKSGAEVVVPEKRFPHFRPGKPLRDRLNGAESTLAAPSTHQAEIDYRERDKQHGSYDQD
jgi:integration host factor subunit beta